MQVARAVFTIVAVLSTFVHAFLLLGDDPEKDSVCSDFFGSHFGRWAATDTQLRSALAYLAGVLFVWVLSPLLYVYMHRHKLVLSGCVSDTGSLLSFFSFV